MDAKIIVPVVTIFDHQGKPDDEANKKVIDFLLRHQVDGILVLGSTGEFTELSVLEKQRFFQFYADYVCGRTNLYAGTGSTNFHQTLELSNSVYSMGYRAPVVIGPYYYGMDQEHIWIYYDTLAKQLLGEMYLYNYPDRSGHSIAVDTVVRLLQDNPNIIGLKDTVDNPGHTNQICQSTRGTGFQVYSGYDDQFLYNLAAGGAGSIGGLANIVPDIWHDLIQAVRAEEMGNAMYLTSLIHRLMPIYQMGSSSAYLFKKLLVHRGLEISPRVIFPFGESDNAAFREAQVLLDGVLEDYNRFRSEKA